MCAFLQRWVRRQGWLLGLYQLSFLQHGFLRNRCLSCGDRESPFSILVYILPSIV